MGLFKDLFNEEGKGKEEIVSGKNLFVVIAGMTGSLISHS